MTLLINPSRFRLGADTAVGRLLGDEPSGLAADFTTNQLLIRDDASPLTTYFGTPAGLLTYTAPFNKYVCNVAGMLEAGTTLRVDHDITTHAPLGLMVEGPRTNVVTRNRDLTHAAWVKTNITAAMNQTGVDGVANSASSITATAANGTVLQTLVAASSTRFQSAYVKRLTGSGAVDMTMDNGTTWTPVTVTSGWTRVIVPSQTLTNPVAGFRVQTSGDAIAVDMVQNELSLHASSPIATTTVAVTRTADTVTLLVTAFPFSLATSTLFAAGAIFSQPAAANSVGLTISDGTAANRLNATLATNGTTQSNTVVNVASVAQVAFTGMGVIAVGQAVRVALAAQVNSFAGVSNGGVALQTDVAGNMPAGLTTMYFGGSQTANDHLNGHLKQVKYLPRRVTNTELQRMVA